MILRETPVHNFTPATLCISECNPRFTEADCHTAAQQLRQTKGTSHRQGKRRGKYSVFLFLHRHSLRFGCTCGAQKKRSPFPGFSRSVSGGIRTRDLQSRSLTRYPAALQTQSTLLLYSVLCRRARLSFSPADCAYAPQVSRIYPRRRAVPRPLSPGSRGRCEGAVPLPCGL